jgi:hypothetical protein
MSAVPIATPIRAAIVEDDPDSRELIAEAITTPARA